MPYGYLIGIVLHGALVALTLAAPRRPYWLMNIGFRVASAYNEVPFLFIAFIVVSTIWTAADGDGDFTTPMGLASLGLGIVVLAALVAIAWFGARARPVVERALADALGADWRSRLDPAVTAPLRTSVPWARILCTPFVGRPRSIERIRNISYGPAGRENELDLYRDRAHPENAPVFIYLHGGGFVGGRKSVEGRDLLFRLAQQGWVTVSANYRLRPGAGFREHLTDVKRVIAWMRSHGGEYGADASTLVVSGGSAGGQLATIAALTPNDPRYQEGFESADTSISAVASLYGWYAGYYELGGPADEGGPLSSPTEGAPPIFVVHGTRDPLAHVEYARLAVEHLRAGSANPVAYAELPGGQHAFDLFRSLRSTAVTDGVEAFVAWVRSRQSHRAGAS